MNPPTHECHLTFSQAALDALVGWASNIPASTLTYTKLHSAPLLSCLPMSFPNVQASPFIPAGATPTHLIAGLAMSLPLAGAWEVKVEGEGDRPFAPRAAEAEAEGEGEGEEGRPLAVGASSAPHLLAV